MTNENEQAGVPTCILTGADGENPDDCTTHEHEPESLIELLHNEVARLEEATTNARNIWLAALPDFPADGQCECGIDPDMYGHWQYIEVGYVRFTNGNRVTEDGTPFLHLATDEQDDMSEQGEAEWVVCNPYEGGCGRAYKQPENVEWD